MLKIYVDATCEHWAKTDGKAKGKIIVYYPVKKRKERRSLLLRILC